MTGEQRSLKFQSIREYICSVLDREVRSTSLTTLTQKIFDSSDNSEHSLQGSHW